MRVSELHVYCLSSKIKTCTQPCLLTLPCPTYTQEREQEVLTLQAQLAQFRQPVLALAGATSAGYGATTWDSDTALATEPLRTSSFSNASWANDWNTAVVRSNESSAAATDRSAVDMLPPVASAATVR